MRRYAPGQSIVVRDMIGDKPFTAWPHRVVADDGHELAVLLRPGTRGIGPALWIEWIRDRDRAARQALIPAAASGEWRLDHWTWRDTIRVAILRPDRYYAIDPMWDKHGTLLCWYVNFQLPYRRTAIGVDTRDLDLDLLVYPDLTLKWKDEDEYAQARRLGLINDECHNHVEQAREQVVALVEQRAGPFAEPWHTWRPDPTWTLPELPADALTEPAAPRPHE